MYRLRQRRISRAVFPSAVREVVNEFAPAVAGVIMIRPRAPGVRQEPPLPIRVELAPGVKVEGLAERIRARLRDKLLVTTEIELAPADLIRVAGARVAAIATGQSAA